MIHERRTRADGFLLQDVARLALGRHKQDRAFFGGQLAHESLGIGKQRDGFFQINDVNLVAVAEDEWCHLGVPETGLMAEMNTGLQHLTHSYSHENSNRKGYKLPLASLTLMSTPTCASGKFASVYSEAARILALSRASLNLNPHTCREQIKYPVL
jgi:hypothetical protein